MNTVSQSAVQARFSPVLAAVVATAIAFVAVLACGFTSWDDNIHVYLNPYLNPVTAAGLRHFWRYPYQGMYIPISYMAFAFVSALARLGHPATLDPRVFHAVNLCLHLANVWLVYRVLYRIGFAPRACAVGAALFGVHPLQVESVAWISELRGLLGNFFGLVALDSFLAARSGDSKAGRLTTALSTVVFALALLAKPSVVTIPLIAWVLDGSHAQRQPRLVDGSRAQRQPRLVDSLRSTSRRASWLPIVWLAMAVPCILIARHAQPTVGDYVIPWAERPLICADAVGFYIYKLFAPLPLGIVYGRTPMVVLFSPYAWLTAAAMASVVAALLMSRRVDGRIKAAIGVFLLALLPNLGLIPFGFQAYSTVADRYVYLAMLGVAMVAAQVWEYLETRIAVRSVVPGGNLVPSVRTLMSVAAALALVIALVTAVQTRHWRNSVSLFTHAIAVNPRAVEMHFNLGVVLADSGDAAGAGHEYDAALRIDPCHARAHSNLAALLAAHGETHRAIVEYRRAVDLDPKLARAQYGLGVLLACEGRLPQAMERWQAASALMPTFPDAHYNLGIGWYQEGNLAAAESELRAAMALNPSLVQAQSALAMVERKASVPRK